MLDGSRKDLPVSSTQLHVHLTSVLWFCVLTDSFLVMDNGCLCTFVWWLIHYCANLCSLLWTQISRVHSSVVGAADCRSAGPWFNSGWRSWFTFVTCSDNPTNQISQMLISMSPITRNSVERKRPKCRKIMNRFLISLCCSDM